MSSRKQILEPIATVIKIIQANFMDIGTKISFNNYMIELQGPSYGQAITRSWLGDDRDDIYYLFLPIIQLIIWQINPLYAVKYNNVKKPTVPTTLRNSITQKKINIQSKQIITKDDKKKESIDTKQSQNNIKNDNKKEDNLKKEETLVKNDKEKEKEKEELNDVTNKDKFEDGFTLFKMEEKDINKYWTCIQKLSIYLCDGLKKIQSTYKTGNVVLTIQYYITLIEDALEGLYSEDRIPSFIIDNDENIIVDYNKIKNLWDFKKISEICELCDKCFATQTDKENDENKKKKIDGYLLAINSLIDISNNDFKKSIVNL